MPYGRTLLTTNIIAPTRVTADGNPKYKAGGITIDLTTIPAALGSDLTLPDGSVIRTGAQYMRYGQVLTRVGVSQVQTIAITGSPTGGTFTITLPAAGVGDTANTTTALAYNASAATVQAALQALQRIGPNGATVSLASSTYTITFSRFIGSPPAFTTTNAFTGGTSPGTTITIATPAGNNNKWGPYDPAASDGRATLARGDAYILDETWVYQPAGAIFGGLGGTDIIGGVIEAGRVWFDRILQSGVAAHTLALGPTRAEIESTFPGLFYATN